MGGRAFLAPRLSGRLRLVIGGALDYYTEQLHVLIGGQQTFATPRLGLQLGIGLGWNL